MGNSTEDYLDNLLKKAIAMDEGDYEIEPEPDDTIADLDFWGNENIASELDVAPSETETADSSFSEEVPNLDIPLDMGEEFNFNEPIEAMENQNFEPSLENLDEKSDELLSGFEESVPFNIEETPINAEEIPLNIEETPINIEDIPIDIDDAPTNIEESPLDIDDVPDNIEEYQDLNEDIDSLNTSELLTGMESELETEPETILDETETSIDDELNSILEDAFGDIPEANISDIPNDDLSEDKLADEEIDSLLDSLGELDSAFSDITENLENAKDESEDAETSFASDAENMDLNDLLSDLGQDDAELSEIGDLLQKDANSEIVDFGTDTMDSLFNDDSSANDFDLTNLIDESGETENKEETKAEKKRRKKEEKAAKKRAKKEASESNGEDESKPAKKEGFFAKLFAAFGDDEDAESEAIQGSEDVFENSAIEIAAEGALENEAILEKMDSEEESNGKKKKKDKKKKDKKNKDDEDGKDKKEKKKEKKAKKEKKPEPPLKKLPKKKIILITILVASVGAIMIFVANFLPYSMDMINAKKHYVTGNYKEAYDYFKGHDLSDSNKEIYRKTTILLKLQRQMDSYKNYMKMGMKPEALNALIQGVDAADTYTETAQQLGIVNEFSYLSSTIETELKNAFGMSLDEARSMIEIESTPEYSRKIYSYLGISPDAQNVDGGNETAPSQSEIQILIQSENEDNEAEGQL